MKEIVIEQDNVTDVTGKYDIGIQVADKRK
jgi:hypothetical protein